MKKGRIFIHHDGALGDTLLSLPSISNISGLATHIHLAGRRDVVQFFKGTGIADEISSADSLFYSSLYTEALDEKTGSFLSLFDRAFVFTCHAESLLVANIRRVIPDTSAIMTIPPEPAAEHAAHFRLTQCGCCEEAGQHKITLCIEDEARRWAADVLKGHGYSATDHTLIVIHPGSGGKRKCWPLHNYASLIRSLVKDSRFFCVVLGGPAEDVAAVSSHIPGGLRVILFNEEPLMRVAALLLLSTYYVGNDSGISHLAGMLGCRGAVLFGPTDPAIWRPLGTTLEIIQFRGQGNEALREIRMRINSAAEIHN